MKSIEAWSRSEQPVEAHPGESVGITFEDQTFVERGELASHVEDAPQLTTVFRATLFWLGRRPLEVGKSYRMRLAAQDARVRVQAIERIIDTDNLAAKTGDIVDRNQVAEVILRSGSFLALDEYRTLARTGRFVLVDDYDTAGGGVISMEGYPDQRDALTVKSTNIYEVDHGLHVTTRMQRNGHRGGVMWFTGLSGAGKSTLAMEVEQQLFRKGYHVYVLDGDNVRTGLNANLGFSPEDRAENIRRVGEAAALFADAGMICITAFISPYQADRNRAREAAPDGFHEIYIKADLQTCEQRDPKGLYVKARSGEIPEFTGISAPYEPPENAELVVDTMELSVDNCVQSIIEYVEQHFALESKQ